MITSTPAGDRLEVLTTLLEAYEKSHSVTLTMIRNLHDKLGIPAEALIQPAKLRHA